MCPAKARSYRRPPVGDWYGDMGGRGNRPGYIDTALWDVYVGVLLVLIVGGRGGASDSVYRPL